MAESDQLFARFGRDCEPGEVLFREGEAGDTMYVLQSGAVRITKTVKGEEKTLAILGAGEFFGEMAILNAKPRNATAIVEEPSRVLVLGARTFEQMVVSNAEIAVRMVKKLARRLDSANELIEVRVAHEHRVDALLILEREHAGYGARVERHASVEQEARGLVVRGLSTVAAEDAELHHPSPNFSRISRKA